MNEPTTQAVEFHAGHTYRHSLRADGWNYIYFARGSVTEFGRATRTVQETAR